MLRSWRERAGGMKQAMRVRRLVAMAVLGLGCGLGPAAAQEGSAIEHERLDHVLTVLRLRTAAAGKACLDAMAQVHQTEDQVGQLTRNGTSDSSKPNPNLDIARDVLGSDYDTATAACVPDAGRVCQSATGTAMTRACAAMNAPASQ